MNLSQPVREPDACRESLIHLLAWIDGWRDKIDGELEERWEVGFRDSTPELVKARGALKDG